ASDKELEGLRAHKVYDPICIESIQPGQNAISSRWVYKCKAENSFKGRVVVQAGGKGAGATAEGHALRFVGFRTSA
ncbi:unnamed protein product, partial [Laminaria digitata]